MHNRAGRYKQERSKIDRATIGTFAAAAFVVAMVGTQAVYAQAPAKVRVLVVVDGPSVSENAKRGWEVMLLRAGLDPVPGSELKAAAQFSPPPPAGSSAPAYVEALRVATSAAISITVTVKPAVGGTHAVRVVLTGSQANKQKFGNFAAAQLGSGVGKLITGLVAQSPPAGAATPTPAVRPVTPVAPANNGPVASAPVASAPVANAPVASEPVASEPVATAATAQAVPSTSSSAASPTEFPGYKPRVIQYGVSGFGGVPVGDFAEVADIGIGAMLTINYDLNPNLQLTGRTGLIFFPVEAEDVTFMAMPIWFGARYFLKPGRSSIYLAGEVGLNDFYRSFGDQSTSDLALAVNAVAGKRFGRIVVESGLFSSSLDGESILMIGGGIGTTF